MSVMKADRTKINDINDQLDTTLPSETESMDESEAQDSVLINAPWQYKMIALIAVNTLSIGAHFSVSSLSAMKSQIKSNLHIDNTKYGVISSSVYTVNTIFTIFGGMFIDYFGSIWGTLAANLVVVIGALLAGLAAQYNSYGLMVAGRLIFGLGAGLIVTMQESILSKWFRNHNLAIAMGIELSVSRLSSFLGTLTANPIAVRTGNWVWAFWLSLIMCCFSFLTNIVYVLVVRRLRTNTQPQQSTTRSEAKKKFDWRCVLRFPMVYWQILLIEFIYTAVWTSFLSISTEFVQIHFGSDAVLAGYNASASQTVPIIATPLIGILMDLYGGRVTVLLLSSIFLILSTVLLGWTYVNAVVGMVFYSISLAFGPVSMITSIGMVLPGDYMGTGMGLYKSSSNIGVAILDIVIGVVQDHTKNQAYTGVMILFLVVACIGFFLIILLWVSQYFFLGNLLETGRKRRIALMQERSRAEIELRNQGLDTYQGKQIRWFNWVCLGVFISACVVAWVLFFVYSASGSVSV
ncbi:unnamed protein product [Rhizopus stolonifer]